MVFGVQFQEYLDKERERQRATNESALSSFLSLPALSSSHLAPQWSHALRQLTPVRVGQGEQVLISSSPFCYPLTGRACQRFRVFSYSSH